jgi:hypothetical protein
MYNGISRLLGLELALPHGNVTYSFESSRATYDVSALAVLGGELELNRLRQVFSRMGPKYLSRPRCG